MGHRLRLVLTDDELQMGAIEELGNKYLEWLELSKQAPGGRKTRAANKRLDTLYDEIMDFKLPPISLDDKLYSPPEFFHEPQQFHHKDHEPKQQLRQQPQPQQQQQIRHHQYSSHSDSETSSTSSRTLRPRSATPSTPTQQSIRSHMKKTLDSGCSSVLTAALLEQHPSVSVTKIRQILNSNSAQKRRDQEKERQERLKLEWKQKEERAEAQKRRLMEEKAITAKMNREERLRRAAEVRKERERAKTQEKFRAPLVLRTPVKQTVSQVAPKPAAKEVNTKKKALTTKEVKSKKDQAKQDSEEEVSPTKTDEEKRDVEMETEKGKEIEHPEQTTKAHKLDETFKKPSNDQNIEINIHDETTDSQGNKTKAAQVASWAKAPHLRSVVISQFDRRDEDILKTVLEIFSRVVLPVDLDAIFGGSKAVKDRYAIRSSSAHWSSPAQLKRTSSTALTPTNPKR